MASPPSPDDHADRAVLISNIEPGTTTDDLTVACEVYGRVESCTAISQTNPDVFGLSFRVVFSARYQAELGVENLHGVEADGREIQANLYQVVSVPATKSVTWKKTPDVTPPASPVLDKSGWHGMQDEEKDTPPDTPATQDAEGTVNTVLKLAAVARSKLEDIKEFVPAKTPSSSTTVPVREGKLSAKAVSFTPQKPAQSTSPTPTTTSFETISTPGVQAAHPRANGLVASVPSPQSTFISAIAMTPRSYNNHYGILHNSALVYNPVALPWLDTSTPDDLFTNCEVANGKEVTELPFELAEFCQTLHMAGIKNVVDLRITVPDSSSVDAFVAEVSKEIPSQLANFAARFRLKQAIRSVLKY